MCVCVCVHVCIFVSAEVFFFLLPCCVCASKCLLRQELDSMVHFCACMFRKLLIGETVAFGPADTTFGQEGEDEGWTPDTITHLLKRFYSK